MNKNAILIIDGQPMEISNALIGARMVDKDSTPFSLYCGNIDCAEIGVSLLHIMRGVIKINREEHGLSQDDARDFLLYTVKTAMDMEELRRNDYSFGYSMDTLIKKYKGNQI